MYINTLTTQAFTYTRLRSRQCMYVSPRAGLSFPPKSALQNLWVWMWERQDFFGGKCRYVHACIYGIHACDMYVCVCVWLVRWTDGCDRHVIVNNTWIYWAVYVYSFTQTYHTYMRRIEFRFWVLYAPFVHIHTYTYIHWISLLGSLWMHNHNPCWYIHTYIYTDINRNMR